MTEEEKRLAQEIEGYNTYEKRKDNDEVFTPPFLIDEMLDKLPKKVWSDPTKTWLDPCAGLGIDGRVKEMATQPRTPQEAHPRKHVVSCGDESEIHRKVTKSTQPRGQIQTKH